MPGETNVGSITGYLRLDTTDWDAHIQAAIRQAERLGAVDPDVHIDVNSGEAIGELEAVEAAAGDTSASMDRLGDSSDRAGTRGSHGMARILKAIIPILPALVPIGGAAIGAAAAFGGLGAAGILAFTGIKKAMHDGTAEGNVYNAGIGELKSNLESLQVIATEGVLDGFTKSVESVNQHMPYLNTEIQHMAQYLGGIAYASVDGILNLMVKLSPVLDMVAGSVQSVAEKFQQWSASSSATDFVSYLLDVLPKVGAFISNLSTTVGHLIQAFAPIGTTVLDALNGVLSVLNSIPIGTLTALATGGLAVYTAFKLWTGLRGLIAGVGMALGNARVSMTGIGVAAGTASRATSALSLTMGGILGAVALGVTAWTLWRGAQQKAEQQQRQLTDAIIQDGGALKKHSRQVLEASDDYKDLSDKLLQFHVGQDELTDALTGSAPAIEDIRKKVHKYGSALTSSNGAAREMGKQRKELTQGAKESLIALDKMTGGVEKSKKKAHEAAMANKEWADKTDKVKESLSDAALAAMRAGDATDKQRKAIDKLNQSIDGELSRLLQLAGSVTAYDSARNDLIKTLKKTKSTTDGATKSGIKNREAIESTVGALQRHRQASIKNGDSTAEATVKYQKQGAELLKQIAKTDGASSATYKYTKRLLNVPKDVRTKLDLPGYAKAMSMAQKYHVRLDNLPPSVLTKVLAETHGAEANLRRTLALIAALHNKTITVTTRYVGSPAHGGPGTHIFPRADGGVTLPGGVKKMAAGGVLDRVPMIASAGSNILWAENSTGGEAYIPMAPSKRGRSTQLLGEVADEFGYTLSRQGAATVQAAVARLTDSDIRRLGDYIGERVAEGSYAGTREGAARHDVDAARAARLDAMGNSGRVAG